MASGNPSTGVDSVLCVLLLLLQGTAAAAAAAAWVAAARDRAAVEAGLRLLHSHSAAVMASLN